MKMSNAWQWFALPLLALSLSAPTAPAADTEAPPPPAAEEFEYVMRPGESVFGVARTFRLSPEELARYNGIDDPSRLRVGQTLKVPDAFALMVTKLTAERSDLQREIQRRDAEITTLRQAALDATSQRDHALREGAEVEAERQWLVEYKRHTFPLFGALIALVIWSASMVFERSRLTQRASSLALENAALAAAREVYRSAVSQVELRYQRLHGTKQIERRGVKGEVADGAAALRRIFADGTARIERLLADRAALGGDPVAASEPATTVGSLRPAHR